ncbi:protein LTO1 homolog isoform X3 [Cricetulus griseus]|uniref:Protein LTO1 homolog isoform X3 n=1 Tax=Cricetulus griseus TaxID=10029 RepID=A0A9J7GUA5_CRIGR|nr:protein LTO1 homolog isoform X3 [Cricetulus griseus]XP_035316793.1 protein LTO1 homolog isoform X3 [Cricetulus griseus]
MRRHRRSPGHPPAKFHGEGYQEGYEEGSSLGIVEGRQYGTLHGAKIGSEIGCYRGFALAWKCLLHSSTGEKDSRKMKVVEALIALLQHFPYGDPTYERLHEDLDRIRGKFRQLLQSSRTKMLRWQDLGSEMWACHACHILPWI